jgi:hypothetical protein
MQSMQAIRLLNSRGYYYDASVAERSLMEATGLCAYLALNQEDSKRWISGKGIKEAKIKWFDYVFKLLDTSTDTDNVRALYGQLSEYVHTEPEALTTLVSFDWAAKRPPKKIGGIKYRIIGLQFTPRFDREKPIRIGSYPLIMTDMLAVIFEKELTEKRSKKIRRLARQLSPARHAG